jgi:hypothetical protein
MARVNSYISHGSGTYGGADKDLHEEWSQKYKKSINCAHPKGFSQKAHCAGKKKQNESVEYEMLCPDCGISEGDTSKLPRVAKDKESGLPKKYVAGLSHATAKARAAHWEKMDKLSDSNPAAYAPAPGDATAKTKESKYTKKYHAMYGESMDQEILQAVWDGDVQVDIVGLDENGLWANIHAKQQRIKNGSGERMRKPGSKGAPTKAALQAAKEEVEFQFDVIEEFVEHLAVTNELDSETVWESLEEISDEELLETAANWAKQAATAIAMKKAGKKPRNEEVEIEEDAKGYKNPTGGLTQKGRDYYNNKFGGHLKAPVTTPPSKLKAGSKAANRRKSFCARMSGVQGPMKKPNGEPTRKALALRKWNC